MTKSYKQMTKKLSHNFSTTKNYQTLICAISTLILALAHFTST